MSTTKTDQPAVGLGRAIAAAAALAAIIIGIPALLVATAGFPLPEEASWSQLTSALTRPDDGTLFLGALTWVAWASWLLFTVLIAIEAIAYLREAPPLRIPGMAWAQIAAAGLVSTAFLGMSGTSASAQASEVAVVAYQAPGNDTTQDQDTGTDMGYEGDEAGPSGAGSGTQTYTVQPGDSYWSIAEARLGTGERYTDIVGLNIDRTMDDGTTLAGDEFLEPGWELILPADSTAPDAEEDGQVHTVTGGETLSSIADEHLGDVDAYPQLVDANPHLAASPDAIDVGWQITIPDAPRKEAPADSTPEHEEEDAPAEPAEADDPATPDSPAPSESAAENAPNEEPAKESAPPTNETQPGNAPESQTPASGLGIAQPSDPPEHIDMDLASDDEDQEAGSHLGAVAGYGALTAAGLLTVLRARRSIQMRRRKPGHQIIQPTAAGDLAAEEQGHHAAAAVDTAMLDRGLRSMAAKAALSETPLPALLGARITPEACELILGERAPVAISPFRVGDGGRWVLACDSPALLSPEQATEVANPYPGLATIGVDAEAQVLIDLPSVGMVGITGHPEDRDEVLSALAVETATSAFDRHVNVSAIGLGVASDVADLVKTGSVRTAATAHECLRELELLTLEYASGDTPPEEIPPEIMISADPLTPEHLGRLRTISGHAAAPPIAIVAAAENDQQLPGPWQLDATPDTDQELPLLGDRVRLQRMNAGDYNQWARLLRTSEATVSVPAPGWEKVPAEPARPHTRAGAGASTQRASLDALTTLATPDFAKIIAQVAAELPKVDDFEVVLRILGPVELVGPNTATLESGKRNLLTELALLLHLRPNMAAEELSRSMGGPRGPWSAKSRSTNLSKLRTWLGRSSSGTQHLPNMSQGRYTLNRTVGSDWQLFQELARRGLSNETAEATATLHAALELVRGEPLSGTPLERYAWAEPLRPTLMSAIIDTAHTIAVRHLDQPYGDLDHARAALAQIIEIDPTAELLYRDLVRVEHAAGNPSGITRTAQRLLIALERIDAEMTEETARLLREHGMR